MVVDDYFHKSSREAADFFKSQAPDDPLARLSLMCSFAGLVPDPSWRTGRLAYRGVAPAMAPPAVPERTCISAMGTGTGFPWPEVGDGDCWAWHGGPLMGTLEMDGGLFAFGVVCSDSQGFSLGHDGFADRVVLGSSCLAVVPLTADRVAGFARRGSVSFAGDDGLCRVFAERTAVPWVGGLPEEGWGVVSRMEARARVADMGAGEGWLMDALSGLLARMESGGLDAFLGDNGTMGGAGNV